MSSKASKKLKKSKLPAPIKIKKEDDGVLHPMSHYEDDRVELIKQVFASLKPKTIKNLAPEFVKKLTMEEIEEKCLNEILGISTKRLTAIINATECPSDTESSSSDSDVNNIEDHISLEEISSDEDNEIARTNGNTTTNKQAKKFNNKKNNKKKTEDVKDKKNVAPGKESNSTSKTKEMSVLELLELQARARAIRSQLALEPVTKIEVDETSNDEDMDNSLTSLSPTPQLAPTKIKIKRNFGKIDDENEKDDKVNERKSTEKEISSASEEIKRERSSSPDVITIAPSPETLFISDSDDEKKTTNKPILKSPQTNKCEDLENKRCPSEAEDGELSEKNEETKKVESDHDDVISLEGGTYEHLEEVDHKPRKNEVEVKMESLDKDNSAEVEDIIDLHTSEDDNLGDCEHNDESRSPKFQRNKEGDKDWNSRWLQSSKVTKVLATSKLGNRLRDKRKTKKSHEQKQKKIEKDINEAKEKKKKAEKKHSPSTEEGTLEQYRKLLEISKEKNSN